MQTVPNLAVFKVRAIAEESVYQPQAIVNVREHTTYAIALLYKISIQPICRPKKTSTTA
jgi:hypothetical protein